MRSPACFILRSVWMVTFFKVHLRIVGPRLPRRRAPVADPEGLSAGQLASGHTGPYRKIAFLRLRATHTGLHPGAEGLVVLRALAAGDGADKVVQVLLALGEVDVAGVDHQEWRLVPAVEEVVVGARELAQVVGVEAALELAPALLDPREQHVQARLQVDDQVRLEDPRPEVLVDALVKGQLVRIEGDRGEDPVLGEQVVGDGHAAEQVLLEQVLLLLEAREQEEELGLEGVLLPVLVEACEERVLLDDLVEPPAPEPLAQRSRQRRLPDTDRPLDHDVAVLQPVHRGAQSSTRPGSLRGLTFARPFICARADQDAGSPAWRAASGSTIRTVERSSPSAGSWRRARSKTFWRALPARSAHGRAPASPSGSRFASASAPRSNRARNASLRRSPGRWASRSPRRAARWRRPWP